MHRPEIYQTIFISLRLSVGWQPLQTVWFKIRNQSFLIWIQTVCHSDFSFKKMKFTVRKSEYRTDKAFILYWTKVKTLHLNRLPLIHEMTQASKANGSVSECSKTELYITLKIYGCCNEERHDSHLNMTGVYFLGCKFEQKSHTDRQTNTFF